MRGDAADMIPIKNEAVDPLVLLQSFGSNFFYRNFGFCFFLWNKLLDRENHGIVHLFDSMVHYVDREVQSSAQTVRILSSTTYQ